jgi:hypothetical protein
LPLHSTLCQRSGLARSFNGGAAFSAADHASVGQTTFGFSKTTFCRRSPSIFEQIALHQKFRRAKNKCTAEFA